MTLDVRSGANGSLEWAGGSDVGRCRDHNEDAFAANLRAGLFVVADGCGGGRSGHTASRIAVDVLTRQAEPGASPPLDPLVRRLHDAHHAIVETAAQLGANDVLGSTAVALRLQPPFACVAYVGDCRAGLLHPPKPPEKRTPSLAWLNDGHRLWQEAARCGETPETIAGYREHLGSVLVHVLGIGDLPAVDMRCSPLKPDSLFLLCSDGVWEQLSREQIAAIVSRDGAPLRERIEALLKAADDAGGHDNATAMLVRYSDA